MSERSTDWNRLTAEETSIRRLAIHVALYGMALLWAAPYVYMVTLSVQTHQQLLSPELSWIPAPATVEWYRAILEGTMVIQWTINTFVVASSAALLIVVVDSMAAFSLTRLDWPGQRFAISVILASFMVPFVVNIVPLYSVITTMDLVNTFVGVILPGAANAFGVFLLIQFFKDIPEEFSEAARLDGFAAWQRFLYIVVPLKSSAVTSLGIFWFIWSWNDFLWPLIVLQQSAKYTLPIGLVVLKDNNAYEPGLVMASAVVAALPLFLLFLVLQKHLIKAVALQGTVR